MAANPKAIVMVRDAQGSHNGWTINDYRKGEAHIVGTSLMPLRLAECFLESGAAKEQKVSIEGSDDASSPADTGSKAKKAEG